MNWIREVSYLLGTLIGVFLIYSGTTRSTAAPYRWLVARATRFRRSPEHAHRFLVYSGFAVAVVNFGFFLWFLIN